MKFFFSLGVVLFAGLAWAQGLAWPPAFAIGQGWRLEIEDGRAWQITLVKEDAAKEFSGTASTTTSTSTLEAGAFFNEQYQLAGLEVIENGQATLCLLNEKSLQDSHYLGLEYVRAKPGANYLRSKKTCTVRPQ